MEPARPTYPVNIKHIHSPANPIVKRARALAKGFCAELAGFFLIEGIKLVEEAQAKNIEIADIIVSQSFFDESITKHNQSLGKLDQSKTLNVIDDKTFNQLCTTATSCGIIALGTKQEYQLDELLLNRAKQPLIIAERIQDPGNLGTMIRTAAALGAKGLILSKGTVDHFSPKVVRASMGSIFNLPIAYDQDMGSCLIKLKTAGVKIVALDAKAEQAFWLENISPPAAYAFGNEGNGLSPLVLSQADTIVNIPISPQTESLNVAVAMGIVLCHTIIKQSK